MEPIRILCICGTGVAGANIIMIKLKEAFSKNNIPIQLITGGTPQVASLVAGGQVDMIVSTSFMKQYENIPYFQVTSFYTGVGEKEVLEEILSAAGNIWEKRAALSG